MPVPASPEESQVLSLPSSRSSIDAWPVLAQQAPKALCDAPVSLHHSNLFNLFDFNLHYTAYDDVDPELCQADSELWQSCGYPEVCDEAGTGAGHAGMAAVGRGKMFHRNVVFRTCLGDGGVGLRVKR